MIEDAIKIHKRFQIFEAKTNSNCKSTFLKYLDYFVHICEYSYSKLIFGRLYLVNSVSYIYAEAFLINGTGQMPISFSSTSGRFLMKNGNVFRLDYFGQ